MNEGYLSRTNYLTYYETLSTILFLSKMTQICQRLNFDLFLIFQLPNNFFSTATFLDLLIIYNFYIALLIFLFHKIAEIISRNYLSYFQFKRSYLMQISIFTLFSSINLIISAKSFLFILPILIQFMCLSFISQFTISLFYQIQSPIPKANHISLFSFNIIFIVVILKSMIFLFNLVKFTNDLYANLYIFALFNCLFTTVTSIAMHVLYLSDIDNFGNSFNILHKCSIVQEVTMFLEILFASISFFGVIPIICYPKGSLKIKIPNHLPQINQQKPHFYLTDVFYSTKSLTSLLDNFSQLSNFDSSLSSFPSNINQIIHQSPITSGLSLIPHVSDNGPSLIVLSTSSNSIYNYFSFNSIIDHFFKSPYFLHDFHKNESSPEINQTKFMINYAFFNAIDYPLKWYFDESIHQCSLFPIIIAILYIIIKLILFKNEYRKYIETENLVTPLLHLPNASTIDLKNCQYTCIICRNHMSPSSAKRLKCHHCMHMLCLLKWTQLRNKCPLCQDDILPKSSAIPHYWFFHNYDHGFFEMNISRNKPLFTIHRKKNRKNNGQFSNYHLSSESFISSSGESFSESKQKFKFVSQVGHDYDDDEQNSSPYFLACIYSLRKFRFLKHYMIILNRKGKSLNGIIQNAKSKRKQGEKALRKAHKFLLDKLEKKIHENFMSNDKQTEVDNQSRLILLQFIKDLHRMNLENSNRKNDDQQLTENPLDKPDNENHQAMDADDNDEIKMLDVNSILASNSSLFEDDSFLKQFLAEESAKNKLKDIRGQFHFIETMLEDILNEMKPNFAFLIKEIRFLDNQHHELLKMTHISSEELSNNRKLASKLLSISKKYQAAFKELEDKRPWTSFCIP